VALDTNALALPLPELTVHTPEFRTADPDHRHGTYPSETGIDPDVDDCHKRYISALKDAVTIVSVENSSTPGESLVYG
jgi:hypothetical protein